MQNFKNCPQISGLRPIVKFCPDPRKKDPRRPPSNGKAFMHYCNSLIFLSKAQNYFNTLAITLLYKLKGIEHLTSLMQASLEEYRRAVLDECEVSGTAGHYRTGLWKLYLQSIIYQKYFPVT